MRELSIYCHCAIESSRASVTQPYRPITIMQHLVSSHPYSDMRKPSPKSPAKCAISVALISSDIV